MRIFKAFDLIVLSYCLACDFMGIFLVGFPGFKLLMNLAVIIVAHKISWRSLIYINMIDLVVIVALNNKNVMIPLVMFQSISVDIFWIFSYLAIIFSCAPFLAAAGIKLLNKLVPERLKTDRMGS